MGWHIRLRGISAGIEGRCWESSSLLRVGRRRTLEIVLEDIWVSRCHAEILRTPGGWWIRDLGSKNGTRLNGARLGAGEWTLRQGDTIRCGNVQLAIETLEIGEGEFGGDALRENALRPIQSSGKTLWNVVIPGNRPLATPAVFGGRVFFGGGFGSHEFYALAADTGRRVWAYHTRDDGPSAAIVEDGLVAFNTESCELEVLTVEGRPVWKKWLGDPLTTIPAAGGGRLFIAFPDSRRDGRHYLGCFHLRTGEEFWRRPIGGDIITAPVLAGGNVYLATVDGTLWCFDQTDGKLLWSEARNATSAPAIWDGQCYYSRRERRSFAQDACQEPFQHECLSRSETEAGGASEDYGGTWCRADYLDYARRRSNSLEDTLWEGLDASVGFQSWKGDASTADTQENLGYGTVAGAWSYQGSRPFVHRGRLYASMGACVQCVDPASGQVLWITKVVQGNDALPDRVLTPPVIVNGKIFLGTTSGEVVCLCAGSGDLLWKEALGAPIGFQPAVAGGRVYVATMTGSLHCLCTGDANDDGWLMWGGAGGHNGPEETPENRCRQWSKENGESVVDAAQ